MIKVFQVWKRPIESPWIVIAENIGEAISKAMKHEDFQHSFPEKVEVWNSVDIP